MDCNEQTIKPQSYEPPTIDTQQYAVITEQFDELKEFCLECIFISPMKNLIVWIRVTNQNIP